ncbi:hypothetical protein ACFSQJ_09135 [Croceitalea marina]|uniref:Uncharacterized protein n=1 Tax=Croceitalea marina TaxID=1775166 RepID=A0ABW5MY63_9FLAO
MKRDFQKKFRLKWRGLSFIFLFLSMDELISIHEPLISIIHSFTNITSGFLYFAWVIPYGISCVLFVFLYLNFLKSLPTKTRMLFIISGITFCIGAIGMELIGGKIFTTIGQLSWQFALSTTVEETLEMLGICLFIYALADFISNNLGSVKTVFTDHLKD